MTHSLRDSINLLPSRFFSRISHCQISVYFFDLKPGLSSILCVSLQVYNDLLHISLFYLSLSSTVQTGSRGITPFPFSSSHLASTSRRCFHRYLENNYITSNKMVFELHDNIVWNEERGVGADVQRGVVGVVMLPLLSQLAQLRQNQQPVSALQ